MILLQDYGVILEVVAMFNIAKISFLLIMIFVVFACATSRYDDKLNLLLGASSEKLVAQFGKPSAKKIINDNTQIWAYTNVDNVFIPSEFYNYDQGSEILGEDGLFSPFLNTYLFSNNSGDIGYEAKYICKTLFLIQNNAVTAWKWQGNNCH